MKEKTELRLVRERKNKTITEIAEALGICVSRYFMIESGERPATPELVESISKLLDVNPEDIFLPQRFTVRKLTGTEA